MTSRTLPMWLQATVLIITTSGSAYIGQRSAVTANAATAAKDPEIIVAVAAMNDLKASVDRLSVKLDEMSTRLAEIDKKVGILDDRDKDRGRRLR